VTTTNRISAVKATTNGKERHGPTREELGAPPKAKENPKGKDKPKGDGAIDAARLWKFPAPKAVTVPLDTLEFDRNLQHRVKLIEPETVTEYAEIMKSRPTQPNGGFPALDAVTDGKTTWVYNGFQRGAALKEAGIDTAVVNVVKGTYDDAVFLSLGANSTNALQRSRADRLRTVFALLDSPDAIKRVVDKAEGNGGVHRVIAAACGVSRSTVADAFEQRGLSASGNKIVKRRTKRDDEVTPAIPGTVAADPALKPDATPAPAQTAAPTPEAQKAANDKAWAELMARQFAARMDDAARLSRKMATAVAALLGDPQHGQTVAKVMAKHGFAVDPKMMESFTNKEDSPYLAVMEHWKLARNLGEMFLDMRRTCEGANNPAPWEGKGEPQAATPAPAPTEAKPAGTEFTPPVSGKPKKSTKAAGAAAEGEAKKE
jgi:hypothetical protein